MLLQKSAKWQVLFYNFKTEISQKLAEMLQTTTINNK